MSEINECGVGPPVELAHFPKPFHRLLAAGAPGEEGWSKQGMERLGSGGLGETKLVSRGGSLKEAPALRVNAVCGGSEEGGHLCMLNPEASPETAEAPKGHWDSEGDTEASHNEGKAASHITQGGGRVRRGPQGSASISSA